jgi:hypothetical protein
MSEASLRVSYRDGEPFVSVLDMAALLLDLAETHKQTPGLEPVQTITAVAQALAGYERTE